MGQKIYKIITKIWNHLKVHLQNIDNSDSVEWWDKELKASQRILATVETEPEYIQKFTLKLLTAAWELLHEIYKERRRTNES